MELSERECWFWLCTRNWLGPASIHKLLGYFKDARNIYYERRGKYTHIRGLKPKVIKQLQCGEGKDETMLRTMIQKMTAAGGKFVSFADTDFPEKLRHIHNPPPGLFYYGKLPERARPMIGIVGARAASSYGMAAAEHFAGALSEAGFGIISGLARGVDGAAHYGALKSSRGQGETWGVLGCGLDICYPKENFKLFEQMKHQGGIITEYPAGSPPEPWHFPMRNRIISAFADGIFVIEAGERSGSLITVDMGLDMGKNIYALPGPFNASLSKGCHRLIQSGAKLVFSPEDILEDYQAAPAIKGGEQENIKLSLDNSEQLVYAILSLTPKDVDDISVQSGLALSETLKVLLELELKGVICQVGKNMYIRKM